jgi:uncharacterized spore protein YtfJ
MDVQEVQHAVTTVRDAVSVKQVFGEPYEKNGVTVIPAARIWGGGGGGFQDGQNGATRDDGSGFGSGFGLIGRPAGAFVIRGDKVRWQPAVDVNALLAALLVLAIVVRKAARRRRRAAGGAQRPAALPGSAEPDRQFRIGSDESHQSTWDETNGGAEEVL